MSALSSAVRPLGPTASRLGRRHAWTAAVVVFFELWAIAFVQNRYMQTPFWRAAFQVVLGGALVFAAGVLIGNA